MTATKMPFVENNGMVSFNTKGTNRRTFSVSHDDRVGFYKTCAQTNAAIVGVQSPSSFGDSYYTIQFRNEKEEKKFSKLLQRNTEGYLYSFLTNKYGLCFVSGLAWFTVGFLMSTTRKSKDNDARPVPQIQKITDQKKLPVQDTSRGARSE